MIEVLNGGGAGSVEEAVLFPFDDHSIPYRAGLRLQLDEFLRRYGELSARVRIPELVDETLSYKERVWNIDRTPH